MTQPGEWLQFTVDIDVPGTYVISARVASRYGSGILRFEFDETVSTAPLVIPKVGDIYATGEFPLDLYHTIRSSPLKLNAGRQTMRVVMETKVHDGNSGVGDFDWFCIERTDGDAQPW